MLDGVHILNTITEYYPIMPQWISIALLAMSAISLVIAVVSRGYSDIFSTVFFIISCTSFVAAIDFALIGDSDRVKSVKYQVTISDNVSMTEFYGKYDVVEKDGEIYTIEEKGGESE